MASFFRKKNHKICSALPQTPIASGGCGLRSHIPVCDTLSCTVCSARHLNEAFIEPK